MQIHVHTNGHIEGGSRLSEWAESVIENAMKRFGNQVIRVEAHFTEENGHKSGSDDKKCVLEARLAGLKPVAVTHKGATVEQALDGASDKLEKTLEKTIGRLGHHKGHAPADEELS